MDRDGVLNRDRSDYVTSWDEWQWIDGIFRPLRRLQDAGYRLVVVTNQSCIGRGLVSRETVDEIHERMVKDLVKENITLDGVYLCPHAPDEGCGCRKPRAGLITRAVEELQLAPNACFLVGDSERDVEAGRRAGLQSAYLVPEDAGPARAVESILSGDG